jgi:peptidyl-tRNA hydrolase, PTH1 family
VSSSKIQAIVGLGNPGEQYERTRHNVGFWLIDQLAAAAGVGLKAESKVMGSACQIGLQGESVRLLKPSTYMNESGQSLRKFIDFYKLSIDQVLVCHDELDLPPGIVRFKQGGGHGGHNGLRSIMSHCGQEFLRLRIGIGHPGHKDAVHGYVLHRAGKADEADISEALNYAERSIATLVAAGLERASTELHTATPRK